jgi:hypothetical protein
MTAACFASIAILAGGMLISTQFFFKAGFNSIEIFHLLN